MKNASRRFFLGGIAVAALVIGVDPASAITVTVPGFTSADINASIALAGTNGKLFFPEGTYDCDNIVANQANQTWEFETGAVMLRSSTSTTNLITRTVPGYMTIIGGVLDGNRINNSSPGFAIVGMVDGCHLTMKGVTVQNISTWAIGSDNAELHMFDCVVQNTKLACIIQRCTGPIEAPQLYRCKFDRSMEPVGTVDSACVLIQSLTSIQNMKSPRLVDCKFYLPILPSEDVGPLYANVVAVELLYAQRGIVENCEFIGGRIGLSLANCAAMNVTSNKFQIQTSYAIELGCSNSFVYNNYGNGGAGSPWSRDGITVNPVSSNLKVYGNTFEGYWRAAVYDPSSKITASWAN